MEHFATRGSKCPYCGYEVDMATSVKPDGKRPKGGDRSVCISCAEVAVFINNTDLRKRTVLEPLDHETERVVRVVKQVRQL